MGRVGRLACLSRKLRAHTVCPASSVTHIRHSGLFQKLPSKSLSIPPAATVGRARWRGVVDERHEDPGGVWFELELTDAWVWDMYRPARFVSRVRVLTTNDVNIEELTHKEPRPEDALGEPGSPLE